MMQSIGTKFLLVTGAVTLVAAGALLWQEHRFTREVTRDLLQQQGELALEFDLALRDYVQTEVRPRAMELAGDDRFVPELMSASCAAREVFERVRARYPDYVLKSSSENPRNPANRAGPEEREILQFFRDHPDRDRWSGPIRLAGREYMARFSPRRVQASCLRCHGEPDDAPASLVRRYGPEAGFGRQIGDVMAFDMVAIPTDTVRAGLASHVRRDAPTILLGLAALLASLLAAFRCIVGRRLALMAAHFETALDEDADAPVAPLAIGGNDEISRLASSFNALAERLRGFHAGLRGEVERQTADLAAALERERHGRDKLLAEVRERERAEASYRALSARHEAILAAVPEIIVEVDARKVYTWANPAGLAFFGEGVVGTEVSEYFAGEQDTYAKVEPLWDGSVDVVHVESWQRRRDGQTRLLSWRCRALKDGRGDVVGVVSTARDITELRRAKIALQEEKAFTEKCFNTLRDVFYIYDAEGRMLRWNAAVRWVSGYGDEEISRMSALDFFVEADRPAVAEAIGRVWKQESASVTARLLTKDGRCVPYDLSGALLRDADGHPVAVCGIGKDVTDSHREHEQRRLALRRQEAVGALQRSVLGAAPLDEKLQRITDGIVDVFEADCCRIWVTRPGDLCRSGCMHARVTDGPHVCRRRDKCLHLKASSGRYTHLDGDVHRRVPFGAYMVGRLADNDLKFLVNDVTTHPHFYNRAWARKLGLVSFAGYQLRPPDGEAMGVLALFSKRPITPEEDALLETVASATAQVIENDREHEAAVAAREQATRESVKLRSMIEGMAEGVVVADAADIVTDVNPWFLEKTGLKRDGVVGKCLWDFHARSKVAARLRAALDGYRDGTAQKMYVVNRELLGMHLSLRVQPMFEGGAYRGVILNAIDVTDLEKARLAAESASRAKSAFLANMSHEIRTPMTAILGFADVLMSSLDDAEALEIVEIIQRNGEHLLWIINDILDVAKIEADQLNIEKTPWSPRELVEEVVSLLENQAQAKGLTLTDEYVGPIPAAIETDPHRLRQILVNVVGNAIKFTEAGSVRIVTRLDDARGEAPKMRFDVIDTGIGISPEQIGRLFEPFTQVDSSSTRRFQGTGLGLALSKRLAQLLGGDVEVWSEPGAGSTFRITIAAGPRDGVPMRDGRTERLDGDCDEAGQEVGQRRAGRAVVPCAIPTVETTHPEALIEGNKS